jgi:hypothetical protein
MKTSIAKLAAALTLVAAMAGCGCLHELRWNDFDGPFQVG